MAENNEKNKKPAMSNDNLSRKMKQWIDNNYNVLIEGKKGTGKTARVLEAWQNAGLKFLYMSASTIDPWVDLIGIPKQVTDENGTTYLDIIQPKAFVLGDVEAIFLDEYNRAPSKVRNAVMEMIQFKTINGKPLSKLRMIWTAINPEDEDGTYDVQRLDPAQKDRFQIYVKTPYELDSKYFAREFGPEIAQQAIVWWNKQTPQGKDACSPRRMEYAIRHYLNNGDLTDVLDETICNPTELSELLKTTPKANEMRRIFKANDTKAAIEFLADEENYDQTIKSILNKKSYYEFFLPLMPLEKISKLVAENEIIQNYALTVANSNKTVKDVLSEISTANVNMELTKKINKVLQDINENSIDNAIKGDKVNEHGVCYRGKKGSEDYLAVLTSNENKDFGTTPSRKGIFEDIGKNMPALLSDDESIKLLGILEQLADRSQESTIEKNYKEIVEMVNTAVYSLQKNKHVFVDGWFKMGYPKLNKYIAGNKMETFIYSVPL